MKNLNLLFILLFFSTSVCQVDNLDWPNLKRYENDNIRIKNVHTNSNIMLAGNIKYNDKLEKFVKIADIIDISGGLETSGKKDKNKINIFLKNVRKL